MRRWLLGAVMLIVGVAADAQEWIRPPPDDPSPITDHMAFRATWFFGQVSTRAQINPVQINATQTVAGTDFNVEQELGLTDKAEQFRAELMFRLEDRNRLRVGFLDLRRNGDAVVDEDIVFGQQVFTKGEEVRSEVGYQQFDVAYTYSILRGKRYELGVGVGAQFIQASAQGTVASPSKFERFDGSTPFAEPLLDGTFLIARHWSFNARGQYLHVTVGNTSGLLEDYHADIQYRYHTALGLGIGYEWQRTDVRLSQSNLSGSIDLKLHGPEAFLRASF
ncbi:MAG TPA: hypothetical protein VHZ99_10880 [Steroidobacteraceae bacterium]|jgi:hypothetical protein|nr:hypothetical protein [Steroidobacteraceae bacterium]